ncbi:MAG: hypothetical protein JW908_08280 [Anaerolineales bacterium]|nr:hypothetical protein [Anaerolineales bacterium]
MARKKYSLWAALTIFAIMLSACQSEPAEPTATQVDPAAIFTAAAKTASFLQTEIAASTPSPTASETLAPVTPTITPTLTLTPTVASGATGVSPDKADFVSDVSVPDETQFAPGQSFTKTWRIKNSGTTTWTTDYALVYATGNQMGGAASIPLTSSIVPGSSVDLSVDLIAPMEQGRYVSYWMLRNTSGTNFGVGPNADQAIFVVINVVGSATLTPTGQTTTSVTPTATTGSSANTATATNAAPTSTSTTASAAVGNLGISVSTPNYSGACAPYLLEVPVSFTVYEETDISFELIAGSDTGGMSNVLLPDPASYSNMPVGTHPGKFTVTIFDSSSGWLQFHVISPVDLYSSKVNILFTCE